MQAASRCPRTLNARAFLYAGSIRNLIQRAMDETNRRRAIQQAYNEQHGIIPQTILRPVAMSLAGISEADYVDLTDSSDGLPEFKSQEELDEYIVKLESDMREAAKKFEFEKAAKLRDTVRDLRSKEFLFT